MPASLAPAERERTIGSSGTNASMQRVLLGDGGDILPGVEHCLAVVMPANLALFSREIHGVIKKLCVHAVGPAGRWRRHPAWRRAQSGSGDASKSGSAFRGTIHGVFMKKRCVSAVGPAGRWRRHPAWRTAGTSSARAPGPPQSSQFRTSSTAGALATAWAVRHALLRTHGCGTAIAAILSAGRLCQTGKDCQGSAPAAPQNRLAGRAPHSAAGRLAGCTRTSMADICCTGYIHTSNVEGMCRCLRRRRTGTDEHISEPTQKAVMPVGQAAVSMQSIMH